MATQTCPQCGKQFSVPDWMQGTANCPHCAGYGVDQPRSAAKQMNSTPSGLIAATWLCCIGTFIPIVLIQLLCSFGMLVLAIILCTTKNTAGIVNGIVALVLWIFTFMVGFVLGITGAM
jgi:hypothetical protein